jgi:hypothetical protein
VPYSASMGQAGTADTDRATKKGSSTRVRVSTPSPLIVCVWVTVWVLMVHEGELWNVLLASPHRESLGKHLYLFHTTRMTASHGGMIDVRLSMLGRLGQCLLWDLRGPLPRRGPGWTSCGWRGSCCRRASAQRGGGHGARKGGPGGRGAGVAGGCGRVPRGRRGLGTGQRRDRQSGGRAWSQCKYIHRE